MAVLPRSGMTRRAVLELFSSILCGTGSHSATVLRVREYSLWVRLRPFPQASPDPFPYGKSVVFGPFDPTRTSPPALARLNFPYRFSSALSSIPFFISIEISDDDSYE
eukprot:scaffold1724_cov341-Pavlova_lutheri.AAC.81